MRRYGLCVGFGIGLLVSGGAVAPVAGQTIGNPLWEIPVKSLTATRDRPVFSPTRRPPPPVPVAMAYVPPRPSAEPANPQLVLIGTVLGAADRSDAIKSVDGIGVFLDQTNNAVVRLKTGDYHNGWLLRSVQGREATLKTDRDTVVLALPARGTRQIGVSYADTNVSTAQPVSASQGRPAPKFQLEKYD